VLLHDAAVCNHHRKHGATAAVGRAAEEGGPDRRLIERTRNHLRRLPAREVAEVDASGHRVGRPLQRPPVGIVDRGGARPGQAVGGVGGPETTEGVVDREPKWVADAGLIGRDGGWVVEAVAPVRALGAVHLHGAAERNGLISGTRKRRRHHEFFGAGID
jgi:hypothetical protein